MLKQNRWFIASLFLPAALLAFISPNSAYAQPAVITQVGQSSDDVVVTAEEYLKRYNKNPQALIRAKLPPEELKIVAKALREKFPYESLVKRLEYEREYFAKAQSQPNAQSEPKKTGIDPRMMLGFWGARSEALRKVHSGEVADFINRNGFGVSRVPQPTPTMFYIPDPKPVPLATISVSDDVSREATVSLPADQANETQVGRGMPSTQRLLNYSKNMTAYFSAPWLWGHVKDREHVAGFKPHSLQYLPELVQGEGPKPVQKTTPEDNKAKPDPNWKTANLELVSLLKHEEPAVYVSDNLPLMSELLKAKTRPLSKFESDAVAKLNKGEEVVHRATTNRIEMVGAIRANKTCTECHYAPEGALLGAFTYEFVRVPPIKPIKGEPAS